jgi:DMSO/TMAO reductase YedYZ molybdopterin-dependent catalytic subunit
MSDQIRHDQLQHDQTRHDQIAESWSSNTAAWTDEPLHRETGAPLSLLFHCEVT